MDLENVLVVVTRWSGNIIMNKLHCLLTVGTVVFIWAQIDSNILTIVQESCSKNRTMEK